MRKMASNSVGPYHGNQMWLGNGAWSQIEAISFLLLTLSFLKVVACAGIFLKSFIGFSRLAPCFEHANIAISSAICRPRRMDIPCPISHTRDIPVASEDFVFRVDYFFSGKKKSPIPEILLTI